MKEKKYETNKGFNTFCKDKTDNVFSGTIIHKFDRQFVIGYFDVNVRITNEFKRTLIIDKGFKGKVIDNREGGE